MSIHVTSLCKKSNNDKSKEKFFITVFQMVLVLFILSTILCNLTLCICRPTKLWVFTYPRYKELSRSIYNNKRYNELSCILVIKVYTAWVNIIIYNTINIHILSMCTANYKTLQLVEELKLISKMSLITRKLGQNRSL